MSVTTSHYFERALIDHSVLHGVRVVVDEQGFITECAGGQSAQADDLCHHAALPGMPDVHSHAHQYALSGRAERSGDRQDSFWTWREVMYRFALRMSPEQFSAVAAQLYVELLKGGYTCVGEFQYLHHDVAGAPYSDIALMSRRLLAAADDVGIGMTLLPVFYRYGDLGDVACDRRQRRFVNDTSDYLRLVESLVPEVKTRPLQQLGLAPHSLRAVNVQGIRDMMASSPLSDAAPIHIHVAEQQREVDDAMRVLRRRPVQHMLDNFDLDKRWCLIHATHMDDQETDDLARTGAVVGICPTTEANLGDGVFRTRRYLSHGGRIAIGSDSNVATTLAGELRLLEYAQRLSRRERNVLVPKDGVGVGCALLDAAQRGGAQALGQRVGRLEVGYRADFITLQHDDPQLFGRDDDIFDAYVFAAGHRGICDVYVGGKAVIRDGHHEQEENIAAACRAALSELAS